LVWFPPLFVPDFSGLMGLVPRREPVIVIRLLQASMLACFLPAAALAQEAPQGDPIPGHGLTSIKMERSVVIPLEENDDLSVKEDEALRSFYGLIGSTCGTVLETIGETCEIVSIGFNFRSGAQSMKMENVRNSIQISGNVFMVVKLKPNVGPPTAENARTRVPLGGNRY
jgi:hypothetical protein